MIGLPTHFLVHAGNGGLIHASAFGPWVDFQWLGAPFAHPAILSRSSQVPGLFKRVFQACRKSAAGGRDEGRSAGSTQPPGEGEWGEGGTRS